MGKLNCDRNIGSMIREIRECIGLKQSDVITFLQLSGIQMTKSAYSKIESGKQHIKISELRALRKLFQVSYDEFFINLENS